jgi:hypothetical protein
LALFKFSVAHLILFFPPLATRPELSESQISKYLLNMYCVQGTAIGIFGEIKR